MVRFIIGILLLAIAMQQFVDSWVAALFLAGAIGIPGTVLYIFISSRRQIDNWGSGFLEGNTRADYMASHPESFTNGKFKGCHHCSENSLFLKQLGNTKHGIHQGHVCRGCGAQLWRSNLES